jgi:hypothetical protein
MRLQHSQKPEAQITFKALRTALDEFTIEELKLLKHELDKRLQNTPDWLDTEYMAYARQESDASISLESVRAALAKIKENMSDAIIEEREDRF